MDIGCQIRDRDPDEGPESVSARLPEVVGILDKTKQEKHKRTGKRCIYIVVEVSVGHP